MQLLVLAKHFILLSLPDCTFLGLLSAYIPYSLCLLNYGKWGNSRTACLPVCVESGCSDFEWHGATEAESVSYEAGTSASPQPMTTGLLSWPISVDFIIVHTVWGEEAAVFLFPHKINW